MEDRRDKVSYIVFEGEMTRMERTNHRLFILLILMLFALIGSNAGWLYYESQWETYTETTVTQEAQADGDSNIRLVGGDYYGESNPDDNN